MTGRTLQHRFVSANGARFHVVTRSAASGSGAAPRRPALPLVLFLHGFPQAWWAWRRQLPAVAQAGYPVAAMDLRGYGDSDKPPRGYDPLTLAADVVGVVRSLGHRRAVVVGQGWGGYVGWTAATVHPDRVLALAAVGAPHPRAMLRLPTGLTRHGLGHVLAMQLPVWPERRIRQAAYLEEHLASWSSPSSAFPRPDDVARSREALSHWPSPHCVLEYHRWLLRSRLRADGRAFAAAMRRPVSVPVLMLTGVDDPALGRRAVAASGRYAHGPLDAVVVDRAGHFPHEEQPDVVTALLLSWLSERAVAGVDLVG